MATIVDFDNLAAAQLGVPYVFGGTSLKGSAHPGLDCSGFPYAVSLALGETIPRTSEAQFAGLTKIPAPQRRGDLVFYNVPTDDQPQPAHMAIWWDEGTVLQAPRTGQNVMFSAPLPYAIMGYRSLPFPNAAPKPPPDPTKGVEDDMITSFERADGSIVTYLIAPGDNHVIEMVRTPGSAGFPATGSNTSIIDITSAFPAQVPA